MSAATKKKFSKKLKKRDAETVIEVDPDNEEAFRIDGELEFPVFSAGAAAKILEMPVQRITEVLAKYGVKAKKNLVYKSGKRIPAYYMSDIHRALVKKVENSFLNPTKPQMDMEPEKYGKLRPGGTGNTKIDHELRLTRARADKAELELAEAAGQLVPIEAVVQDVGDMLASFKARALSLPPKLASTVPLEIRSEVETSARVLVNETLEELAKYRPRVHRRAGTDAEAAADTQG